MGYWASVQGADRPAVRVPPSVQNATVVGESHASLGTQAPPQRDGAEVIRRGAQAELPHAGYHELPHLQDVLKSHFSSRVAGLQGQYVHELLGGGADPDGQPSVGAGQKLPADR